MNNISGWWFQPIWNICSAKWESSPIFGVNIKNIWVATTQIYYTSCPTASSFHPNKNGSTEEFTKHRPGPFRFLRVIEKVLLKLLTSVVKCSGASPFCENSEKSWHRKMERTVDGRNSANQLRLVVYLTIYIGFTHPRWLGRFLKNGISKPPPTSLPYQPGPLVALSLRASSLRTQSLRFRVSGSWSTAQAFKKSWTVLLCPSNGDEIDGEIRVKSPIPIKIFILSFRI